MEKRILGLSLVVTTCLEVAVVVTLHLIFDSWILTSFLGVFVLVTQLLAIVEYENFTEVPDGASEKWDKLASLFEPKKQDWPDYWFKAKGKATFYGGSFPVRVYSDDQTVTIQTDTRFRSDISIPWIAIRRIERAPDNPHRRKLSIVTGMNSFELELPWNGKYDKYAPGSAWLLRRDH